MTIQHDDGPKPGPRKLPLYLNWQLWIVGSVSFVLLTVGLFIVFGTVAIAAAIVALAGLVSLTAGPVIGAYSKVNAKIQEVKEAAQREATRNQKIESTAVKAATTAEALASKVDLNADRSELLEKSNEALSRQYATLNQSYAEIAKMARDLADNLQQERTESKAVLADLKAQLRAIQQQNLDQQNEMGRLREYYQDEINKLSAQIRLLGVEKVSDTKKIFNLETQVRQLQERVKELEDRENTLNHENSRLKEELKTAQGMRRSTDVVQLPGLASGDMVRLERIEESDTEGKER